MMSSGNKRQERKIRRLANTILKRENGWMEVGNHQLGDIKTELSVYVSDKSAVAGNILAPKVIVSGIVFGFVTSREVLIEPGGQIWGDIHTVSLEVAPGGKLHGWLSTLDEGTIDLLRSGELNKRDIEDDVLFKIPDEIIEVLPGSEESIVEDRDNEFRMLIWRQLRAEAAVALIARSEIEATFERRLRDLVNASKAQTKEKGKLEAEVIRLRKLVDSDLESIQNRDEQIAALRAELVEMEIEFNKTKEITIKLSRQLQRTKQLAKARIQTLENKLAGKK